MGHDKKVWICDRKQLATFGPKGLVEGTDIVPGGRVGIMGVILSVNMNLIVIGK